MTNYTPEHLTNLLTTDREKLTRICAEVCYGWEITDVVGSGIRLPHYSKRWQPVLIMPVADFQPLSSTEKGRSQAFGLAVKFHCFPHLECENSWFVFKPLVKVSARNENPQAAIVIAAILTSQQENNDV